MSSFSNQNLDVGFDILEENLIHRGQEIIDCFWDFFFFLWRVSQ